MTELSSYVCTCGSETGDHHEMCSLMECGAFTLGVVLWTGEGFEPNPDFDPELLRPTVTRERKPGQAHNTTTFMDWAMLDRIDETIDLWKAHPDDAAPYNFSALGVTWVWNPAAARWDADTLGCHCGETITDEDGYEICERCQVIRKGPETAWLQGHIAPDEPVCRCVPPAKYACTKCNVRRTLETHPWEMGTSEGLPPLPPRCDHRLDELFLEGVSLYGSRFHHREAEEDVPDYGVYLDKAWAEGDVVGTLIPWSDFGLPRVSLRSVHKVCVETLERATREIVEVACLGGHGRTGTFLACCAVVNGMTAGEAIAHVRDKYCDKAIETKKQEWYVHAMHAVHHNIPAPPMPEEKVWQPTKEVTFTPSLLGQTPRCQDCQTSPLYANATTCDICGGTIV